MKIENETKNELKRELENLRKKVAELKKTETERKKAQERIEHLNLCLRAIHNLNKQIISEKNRDNLLKSVCENLIKTRGYFNVWLAILDESEKYVTHVEAGLGKDFKPLLQLFEKGKLTHCGRTALDKEGVLAIEDPRKDCSDCPLADKYSGKGAMTARLEYKGKVFGMMSVSMPARFVSSAQEVDLLRDVAEDIAFALYRIELDEKYEKRERKIRTLSFMVEQSTEGMGVADLQGKLIFVNDAWAMMHGYESGEELSGRNLSVFHNKEQLQKDVEPFNRKTLKKGSNRGEVGHMRRDGTVFPTLMTTTIIKDEQGKPFALTAVANDITELKQAQSALMQSKREFSEIVHGNSIATFVVDSNHRVTQWNRAMENLTGIKENQIVGTKNQWKAFYPEKRPVLADLVIDNASEEEIDSYYSGKYEKSKSMDGAIEGEDFFLNLGDKGKWCLFTASPIKNSTGKIIGAVETLQDITERKKAEEALNEREAFNYALFQHNPMPTIVVDLMGKIVAFNFAKGKSGDRLPKVGDLMYKDYAGRHTIDMRAELMKCIKSGKTKRFPAQKYNDQILDITISPFYKGAVIISQNITRRKMIEEMLMASEQKYRTMVERSPDAIITLDKEGKVTSCNATYAELTGYSKDYIVGRHFSKIPSILSNDIPKFAKIFKVLLLRESAKSFEIEWTHKNGSHRLAEIRISPLEANDKLYGFQVVANDITQRKKAQYALQERAKELNGLYELSSLAVSGQCINKLLDRAIHEIIPQSMQFPRELIVRVKLDGKIFCNSHKRLAYSLSAPITIKGVKRGDIKAGYSKKHFLFLKDQQSLIEGYASIIAIHIENSETQQSIKTRTKELEALISIASVLNQPMELEKMLETALERILAVMNLEFGGIYIADPEKRQIELFAYRGVSENYARSVHSISVDEDTIRRLTISAQRGKLIPSFSMMLKNLKTMKKVLSAMKKEGLNPKYTTNVILQCKDKIQGALVVGSKRAQPLDESGQKLIISIAQQLSAAISNTQLLAESRKEISSRIEVENALRIQQKLLINAQKELKYFTQRMLAIKEEEKKKLSSYLHDEIGAMSISLNAYLPITEQHVANRDCTSAFKAMKDNQAAIKRAISRLRKAMVDLWPPDLEILGLPDALRSYISELEKQTNLRVYYTSRLGRHVPADDMAIVIYRIVQESLNNIIKHADAKMAQVQLGRQDSNVRLTIRDDGKGFDVAKHACEMKKTIGLRAMREMTESLEGNFCIESRPGRGTKIEVVFPLKGPEK